MSKIPGAAVPVSPRADDELLTIQEVDWRHLGTGPRSFRIGRSVLYWRTEVFAWLDEEARSDRQSVLWRR